MCTCACDRDPVQCLSSAQPVSARAITTKATAESHSKQRKNAGCGGARAWWARSHRGGWTACEAQSAQGVGNEESKSKTKQNKTTDGKQTNASNFHISPTTEEQTGQDSLAQTTSKCAMGKK